MQVDRDTSVRCADDLEAMWNMLFDDAMLMCDGLISL